MSLDFRAALRSIARSPGFFLGAVLTLGLGLGAVVTSFGLLAGALGRSGVGNGADPVVLYLTEHSGGRQQRMRWPYTGVQHLRATAKSYSHIATYTIGEQNLSGAGESARLDIEFVSSEYFDVTAMHPFLGRGPISAQPETPGSPAEIVLGYALWQRAFGGSASALARLSISRHFSSATRLQRSCCACLSSTGGKRCSATAVNRCLQRSAALSPASIRTCRCSTR